MNTGPASLRLDKWLWFARLARTRSLAARLCSLGCVRVGGAVVAKPHHGVRVGDTVTVELPRWRRRLIVQALGTRRGPAAEARLLYHEPEPAVAVPAAASAAWTSLFEDEESWKSA
jgi:ribosome-associated heat shock protein Hsp15